MKVILTIYCDISSSKPLFLAMAQISPCQCLILTAKFHMMSYMCLLIMSIIESTTSWQKMRHVLPNHGTYRYFLTTYFALVFWILICISKVVISCKNCIYSNSTLILEFTCIICTCVQFQRIVTNKNSENLITCTFYFELYCFEKKNLPCVNICRRGTGTLCTPLCHWQKSRCVCETLTMPPAATKSKKAIFRAKVKVKVTR